MRRGTATSLAVVGSKRSSEAQLRQTPTSNAILTRYCPKVPCCDFGSRPSIKAENLDVSQDSVPSVPKLWEHRCKNLRDPPLDGHDQHPYVGEGELTTSVSMPRLRLTIFRPAFQAANRRASTGSLKNKKAEPEDSASTVTSVSYFPAFASRKF